MSVSQQAIADALHLSRTTVTKILNRDPRYSASEATRELVFRTAERLGYDFTTIRRPFKREYGRTDVSAPCRLEVVLNSGEIFDRGEAIARNVGVGGALLVDIHLSKNVVPLSGFIIRIYFNQLPALANLVAECQLVRIADSTEAGKPEVGVRFINASVSDRKLLKEFVDQQAELRLAARQKAVEGHKKASG